MNRIRFIILVGLISCKPKADNSNITQSDGDGLISVKSAATAINDTTKPEDYGPIKSLDYGKVELYIRDTSQFHLLKGECAITEYPDTTWLRQYQESMSEDSWNEIIFDNQHYEALAIDTLEQAGVKVFTKLSWRKRYLMFQKEDNSTYILDKAQMKDSWGIILFNGHDDPIIWDDSFISSAMDSIYK